MKNKILFTAAWRKKVVKRRKTKEMFYEMEEIKEMKTFFLPHIYIYMMLNAIKVCTSILIMDRKFSNLPNFFFQTDAPKRAIKNSLQASVFFSSRQKKMKCRKDGLSLVLPTGCCCNQLSMAKKKFLLQQ